jgi:hypothetical protein
MNLYWEQYMGPGGHRADGRHNVYIVVTDDKLAKLYQMPKDEELSPLTPQRARKYQEYGPGAAGGETEGYRWESAVAQAKARAQGWEDADS